MSGSSVMNEKIFELCNKVINDLPKHAWDGQLSIIGIDGPTAAGKTIFANQLAKIYSERTKKESFIYRVDWTLRARDERIDDLAILKKVGQPFHLEAELHMRLDELAGFLRRVYAYNSCAKSADTHIPPLNVHLTNLYSRENNGLLTEICNSEIKPGSLIIVEGHYPLRSELHQYFDINLLLLSDKKTLIERKISRVSGYRGAAEAEAYFHFIDSPSFEHHLARYGRNATHIIQNNNFESPDFVEYSEVINWVNQEVKNELKKEFRDVSKDLNLKDVFLELFSASSLMPRYMQFICEEVFSSLERLDGDVSRKVTISVAEQTSGLTEIIDDYLDSLNYKCRINNINEIVELKFTNSLHNVYFRIFPISFAIGIKGESSFAFLVDIYEEKIVISICWEGGITDLICARDLSQAERGDHLRWKRLNKGLITNENSNAAKKILVLSPANFTIPPIFDGVDIDLKITGKEQLNISSSECFRNLNAGNACWIARLALQSEVDFFYRLALASGAQALAVGNYLIALKSDDPKIVDKFELLRAGWHPPVDDAGDQLLDRMAYDNLVINERNELVDLIGDSPYFKILDTHLFLRCVAVTASNHDAMLNGLANLLLSPNRLMRKRAIQFIVREYGDIELPVKNIWPLFPENSSAISIETLARLQPTILAEIYLWMSIKKSNSAILGANVYDISENSLDAIGHLRAAISEGCPIVLQASLNALGPVSDDHKGGYLCAKNGAVDLISAVLNSAKHLFLDDCNVFPIFGIGLDHIDSRNDYPEGRARKFLESAIESGLITHVVLDGSSLFNANDTSDESLSIAYDDVASYTANLARGLEQRLVLVDKEICGGELNYIGAEQLANIPNANEIALFVKKLMENFRKSNLRSFLRRPNLFIGNVGTTHHSGDLGIVKSEVSGEWVDKVKRSLFVSAVLHGTTGSKPAVLQKALAGCKKINIAGDFLKTYTKALPLNIQQVMASRDPHEPKKALAFVRNSIEELPGIDRKSIEEAICDHSKDLMRQIHSPHLTNSDKIYFHHSPYIFSKVEVNQIISQIRNIHTADEALENETVVGDLDNFCASLIEVPYGEEYIQIVKTLLGEGIKNFHIDVGDGGFISRNFSGLVKLAKILELDDSVVTSTHLMVRDPHIRREGNSGQSYIESYAKKGCSRIGIHLKSVSDHQQAKLCFDMIRSFGSQPGIVIEVDEIFNGDMRNLLLDNKIKWLVVMGVRIGFGGQIFNSDSLNKIRHIRQFSDANNLDICIEVDGGLTMNNISACRKAGADLFAGWSIIKPDDSMTLCEKLAQLRAHL